MPWRRVGQQAVRDRGLRTERRRPLSHYDVLGVGPSADEASLHRAYLALARRHHPDVEGGDPGRMQAINEAWATLGDPVQRARYDRMLDVYGATATRSAADPAEPSSPADDPADLDDAPWGGTVVLPRWLGLLPVATFALSVAAFCIGLVVGSEPVLGLALMAFVLSCLFFLAAPFVALLASRLQNR